MDDDDEETSISVINGHCGDDVQEDGDIGVITPMVTPQYHMFSGAIPKDVTKDVTASASHHALILAYRDLKKRYDLLTTKDRQSPQLRRSATVSTPLTPGEYRRSARKSANIPFKTDASPVMPHRVVSPQMQRQIDARRREMNTRQETDCVETETECLKSLLWEQKKEVNRLKREVDDLRLTIAGREQKEAATGTSSDDMVRAAIRQVQQMKKLLQQKNLEISQLLLKQNINEPGFERSIEHAPDLEFRARCPRIISVDSVTESKVIRSIDETDSIDFSAPNYHELTMPNNCPEFGTPNNWTEITVSNNSSPDLYGMPTMTLNTSPVMRDLRLERTREQRLEESDGGWVRLEHHRAAVSERSGSLDHSAIIPPRRPPFVPMRHSYDNACMSVNLNPHAFEQTQRVAIPNDDLLPHKPTASYRNICHDGGASGDCATAAAVIECPLCSQRFDVPQNSPEFQRHVDECLQTSGSTDGLPRHCPVCDDAFPATVEQKDYELHVNRHFDDDDVVDRFDVLDFATLQHNDNL